MASGEKEPDAALVSRALRAGVAALLAMQQPDGSFPVLQREQETPWRPCHPLFSTLSVLLAAGSLMPREAVSRAVDFIRHCRRPDGYWEFDPTFSIPPDADDTACALAVLARHGSGRVGADDAALLRSFWRADGGPFQTWRGVGMWSERDRDDAVVNCNVLLALAELGVPANPEESNAVVSLLQRSTDGCRYYCSPTTIAYAARRGGLTLDALPASLAARPRQESGALPLAQWLSLVRRWDADAVAHVLAAQTPDGSWQTEAWFRDQSTPPSVWGSPAISSALCVEALQASLAAAAHR